MHLVYSFGLNILGNSYVSLLKNASFPIFLIWLILRLTFKKKGLEVSRKKIHH